MIMKFSNIGINLFCHTETIHEMWSINFGNNFLETWQAPDEAINDVVRRTRETLAKNKGIEDISECHATLFLRDPLSDRLILTYSTKDDLNPQKAQNAHQKYFSKDGKDKNYDSSTKRCYYPLYDRLSRDDSHRVSPETCRERGLTGWVAVTGLPLRVNSVRYADNLSGRLKENKRAMQQCIMYGYPKWGSRISEFLRQDEDDTWSTRYIAVPVKSLIETDKTIGVLRFTGPLTIAELTQFDLFFLEGVAGIIAALLNIHSVKVISNRDRELEKEEMRLNSTGDISKFLEFIATSLRSRISSLYIYISVCNQSVLRLFDAHGISGRTGELRKDNAIKDYNQNTGGLTYNLLYSQDQEPIIHNSVVDADNWRGINTHIFYKTALAQLGLQQEATELKDIIKRFQIKLIGCSLKEGLDPIGVLKVEFPITFDDWRHYHSEKDKVFFKNCAEILQNEIIKYKTFIEGEIDTLEPTEFVRLMLQINRYRLLEPKDNFKCFWDKIEKYFVSNKQAIKEATYIIAEKLPYYDSPRLHDVWSKIGNSDWFKFFLQEVIDIILKMYGY